MVDSLTQALRDQYAEQARKASESPEISGEYGRDYILDSLLEFYMFLNPNDPYLNELRKAIAFVVGTDPYSITEIKDPALRGTIDRQIIIPFLEEYKSKGSVDNSKLERWIAIWLRDRDAELRNNIKTYTAKIDTIPANERLGIVASLAEIQLRYTTAIVRRMANLLKAKYPDKVTEMDVIYNQVTRGDQDIKELVVNLLTGLEAKGSAPGSSSEMDL